MNWLADNKATKLKSINGWNFYENPFKGDEAPVLAVHAAEAPASPVYNTQDFDLPFGNEDWWAE